MSLGSGYDMVLLPPRGDVEPRPEPIPPQSLRGRRSGHHAGAARRGRHRSRISDPTTEARVRPALPPHIPHQVARSSGPTGARGRAHGASSSAPQTNRRSSQPPVLPRSKGKARLPPAPQKGDKGTSLSHPPPPTGGGETAAPPELPFWAWEHSRHLRIFREHFVKCVRGSPRAPPEVYSGPYRYTACFIEPRGSHLRR